MSQRVAIWAIAVLGMVLGTVTWWLDFPLVVSLIAGAILGYLLTRLFSKQGASDVRMASAASPDFAGLTAAEFSAELDDPVLFFSADGTLIDANRAAIAAFGQMSPGLPVLLKFRAPEVRDYIEQVISGETPSPIDYIERVPVERVYRLNGSTIGAGDMLRVLVFRDQSEARRIDRMRADFIANASHELRTPLASISGFVETLKGPARNDSKAREQFLDIMQAQAGRMSRLLDDLLSLSRLEMKPRVDGSTKADLKDVIDRVIDTLGPLAKEMGVVIEKDVDTIDASVAGDRDELFQVFENLVENACKYGQSGGKVVVALRPGTSGPQPEVDVTVTDFGPGISSEHIPRITERFYRVDVETSRAQKGTGLGLAIVKHILTRHNARLAIRSEPGKGSSFTAHFPVPN